MGITFSCVVCFVFLCNYLLVLVGKRANDGWFGGSHWQSICDIRILANKAAVKCQAALDSINRMMIM